MNREEKKLFEKNLYETHFHEIVKEQKTRVLYMKVQIISGKMSFAQSPSMNVIYVPAKVAA